MTPLLGRDPRQPALDIVEPWAQEWSVASRPQTSKVNGGCGDQGSDRRRNGCERALAKRFEVRGLQVGRREGGFVERALGEATRGGDISEVSPSSFGVGGSVGKVSTRCSAGCLFRRGRHSGGRRAGRLRHGCGRRWRHRWHQGLRPRFGRGRVFEIVCGNEFFATTEELATGLPGALRDRVLSPLDLVFAGGYTCLLYTSPSPRD